MDPVSMIVAALAAGVAAGAGKTATQAVTDAYGGVKSLVKRLLAGRPDGEKALALHEADPETWEKPLERQLRDAGAEQDPDLLAAAEHLLELTKGAKYHVRADRIGIVGDGAKVDTIKLGDDRK